jgi:hypothetical protein
MWSRRRGQGPYLQFIDSSENTDPNWHPEQIEIMDRATNFKVNFPTTLLPSQSRHIASGCDDLMRLPDAVCCVKTGLLMALPEHVGWLGGRGTRAEAQT